ncbi:MAG: hypothetical protein ACTSRU_11990 [Candidatus Hodarchaeales archaeon]
MEGNIIEWDLTRQLRFNILAKVRIEEEVEFKRMKKIIDGFGTAVPNNEDFASKFSGITFDLDKTTTDTKKTFSEIIATRYYRGVDSEIRDVVIFWFYPQILILNGRRSEVKRALNALRFRLLKDNIKFTLEEPEFEWYYFLKIFEIAAERRYWTRTRDITDSKDKGPSTKIAQGINLVSIHDVSSVGEIDPIQAQKIIVKGSGDATQDLSTGVSFLEGRKPESVLIYGTVDKKPIYVRLYKGGRLHILKRNPPDDNCYESKEGEMDRLAVGLQFSKRIINSYFDWLKKPVDDMLPTGILYDHIKESVESRIKPLLRESVSKRKKDLVSIRNEINSTQKKLDSESGKKED